MGRMAPVLWLLILTGCAAEQPPQPPSAVSAPAQATSAARPPIAPPPPLRGYVEEVDELFRALAERDARAGGTSGTATGTGSQGLTAASIPRVSGPDPTPDADATFGAAYEENLEVCLDGRFPAFCDHERLTGQDAARARKAEYEANLVTCIDPQWQHLCRPELLPRRRSRPDRRAQRGRSGNAPAERAPAQPASTLMSRRGHPSGLLRASRSCRRAEPPSCGTDQLRPPLACGQA